MSKNTNLAKTTQAALNSIKPTISSTPKNGPRLLDNLLNQVESTSSTSSTPSSSPRPLGSIDSLLTKTLDSQVNPPLRPLNNLVNTAPSGQTPIAADSAEKVKTSSTSSLFTAKSAEKNNSSTSTTSTAFPQAKQSKSGNPSLLRNLSFIILGIFGLGALTFGFSQFIENANINFAAQDPSVIESSPVTPPQILSFQGRLSDFNYQAVDSVLSMRFQFYNSSGGNTPPPIGGELLWDRNLCSIIPNNQGVFSVNLGAGAGQGSDDFNCGASLGNVFTQNSNLWLQITVNDEILFPRQMVKSVPFALNSATLQGFSASQSATANTIPVLDENGNLNFNTTTTTIINTGALNLTSITEDIYFLPGGGDVFVGSATQEANLNVTGDLNLANDLIFSDTQDNSASLSYENGDLIFRTQTGQNLATQEFAFNQTDNNTNQFAFENTGFNFNFLNGPDLTGLTVTDDGEKTGALQVLPSPTNTLSIGVLSQEDGNLNSGTYQYAYSFVTASGEETSLSDAATIQTDLANKQFLISGINTYDLNNVVARKIYRTTSGGDQYYHVYTIPDNTTTSFIDNLSDSDLIAKNPNITLNPSTFSYKVAFLSDNTQTNPSTQSVQISLTSDNRQVKLDNIPLGNQDTSARLIYRTLAGGNQYYLLTTLDDNSTSEFVDTVPDSELAKFATMPVSGGIFANDNLALQLDANGSIITNGDLIAAGRIETGHSDNQGLQIPTTAGVPQAVIGQQAGDLVYDTLSQTVYVYSGDQFIPLGQNSTSSDSSNCANDNCRLSLDPEYPSAVLTATNSNSLGSVNSGYDLINNQYRFNYYQWSSTQTTGTDGLQINLNLIVPGNFSSWNDQSALTLDFLTSSTLTDDNSLSMTVYKNGSTAQAVSSTVAGSTANQWNSAALGTQPLTLTATDLAPLNVNPGDLLTIQLNLASKDNQYVRVSQLNLNYQGDNSNLNSLWSEVAGAIFPTNLTNDVLFGGDSTASAKAGFLNLGNFGTPTFYLQGNIFLDSLLKENFLDVAYGNSFGIRTLDSNNQAQERVTLTPEGNLGVNVATPEAQLDIGGSLRLSPITTTVAGPCSNENAGSIYYNNQDWQLYVCTSTDGNTFDWQLL